MQEQLCSVELVCPRKEGIHVQRVHILLLRLRIHDEGELVTDCHIGLIVLTVFHLVQKNHQILMEDLLETIGRSSGRQKSEGLLALLTGFQCNFLIHALLPSHLLELLVPVLPDVEDVVLPVVFVVPDDAVLVDAFTAAGV